LVEWILFSELFSQLGLVLYHRCLFER